MRSRRKPANAKKGMKRPEQILQIAIFNFLRPLMVVQKREKFIAFSIPNGGYRTPFEANIFKATGVMAGASDILFLFNGGQSVFVELKAKGGGGQTDNQKGFQESVEFLGFDYILLEAGDAREAVNKTQEILRRYGVSC